MKEAITIVPGTVPDSQLIQSDYIWYKLRSCIVHHAEALIYGIPVNLKALSVSSGFPDFGTTKL